MARPRQISDEEIIAAARAVFVEHGPAASTASVADTLGVSQPALFKRFGSKEGLMMAALAPPQRPAWVQHVERGPDNRSLEDQLRDIAYRVAQFFREVVPCLMALRASGIAPETLMNRYAEGPPPLLALNALVEWFERAKGTELVAPSVAPYSAANMFLGALHLRVFLHHLSMGQAELPPIDDPEHIEQVVTLVSRSVQR